MWPEPVAIEATQELQQTALGTAQLHLVVDVEDALHEPAVDSGSRTDR